MEHKEIIPKTIAISAEVDNEASRIRSCIQKAQDAFAVLRADTSFLMPSTLEQLTPEYCKDFYRDKRRAIDTMIVDEANPLEVARKQKLQTKMERKQSETTRLIGLVRAFLDSSDLAPRYDQLCENIVPSADIHAVAVARVTRNVPEQAQQHYDLIQDVCAAIDRLRTWERKGNVKKIPLQSLCRKSTMQIAEEWATGDIYLSKDEDSTQKVIRESVYSTDL